MPIVYTKDDALRRVTLTVVGQLTGNDLTEAADRQAADHAWGYGVMLDARARTGDVLTAAMVRTFVQHNARISAEQGEPGPFVVVPHDDAGYGMGRMFEMLTELHSTRRMNVCLCYADAVEWLKRRTTTK